MTTKKRFYAELTPEELAVVVELIGKVKFNTKHDVLRLHNAYRKLKKELETL